MIQEEVARTRRVHRDVALGEEGEEGAQGLPCHEVATGSAQVPRRARLLGAVAALHAARELPRLRGPVEP